MKNQQPPVNICLSTKVPLPSIHFPQPFAQGALHHSDLCAQFYHSFIPTLSLHQYQHLVPMSNIYRTTRGMWCLQRKSGVQSRRVVFTAQCWCLQHKGSFYRAKKEEALCTKQKKSSLTKLEKLVLKIPENNIFFNI